MVNDASLRIRSQHSLGEAPYPTTSPMQTYLSMRSERNASTTAFIASMFAWTSEKMPMRMELLALMIPEVGCPRGLLDQIRFVELRLVVVDEVRLVEKLHRAGLFE